MAEPLITVTTEELEKAFPGTKRKCEHCGKTMTTIYPRSGQPVYECFTPECVEKKLAGALAALGFKE